MYKFLVILTAFPGNDALKKWDSLLQKFVSGVASAMTGNDADISMWATKSDKVVNFYLSNQHWLNPNHEALTVVTGWLQNVIYGLLTWLAGITTALLQGSLYLFDVIPQQLMDKNSEFHGLFVAFASISIAMSIVSVIFWTFNYARGAKDHKISALANNMITSLTLMFVLPTLTVFIGWALSTYVSPIIGTTNQGSLAMKPLADNTVDMETWAMDGFQHQPFSKNAPQLNDLNDSDSFIPDFSESVDAGEIAQINSLANQINNKSVTPNQAGQLGGHVSSSSVDIKKVGNVFNYQVVPAPTAEAGQHASRYTISKIDIKGSAFGVGGGMTSVRYKRYRVQNISAILSYLIIIILSVLMSIKVGRSALGAGFNLGAGIMAIGRDVGTTQPAKTMIMEQINTGLVVMIDVLMMWLSASVITSWPKLVADHVASLGSAGTAAWPIVYVLIMALIALAIYSGTGAIQRVFGIEDGLNDSFRSGSMMTAISSFIAGGMFNSVANAKDTHAMNQRLDALSSDKADVGRDTQAITNAGEKDIIDDSSSSAPSGGGTVGGSSGSTNENNTEGNTNTSDSTISNNGPTNNPQTSNDFSNQSVSDGGDNSNQNMTDYGEMSNDSAESNDYSNNQADNPDGTNSEMPNAGRDGLDGAENVTDPDAADQGTDSVINDGNSTDGRPDSDSDNGNLGDKGVLDDPTDYDSDAQPISGEDAPASDAGALNNRGANGLANNSLLSDGTPVNSKALHNEGGDTDSQLDNGAPANYTTDTGYGENNPETLNNQGAEKTNVTETQESVSPQNVGADESGDADPTSDNRGATTVNGPTNNGTTEPQQSQQPSNAEREIRQAYGQKIANRNARHAQNNHDRAQLIKQQLLQGQPAMHQRPVNRGASSKVD